MQRSQMSRSALARATAVDRSTIGQLLKDDLPRLPNAQLAADAAAMAAGAMLGKDPAIGSPLGAITTGHANVIIGGFPMPSGMQIAGRYLGGARSRRAKPRRAPGRT